MNCERKESVRERAEGPSKEERMEEGEKMRRRPAEKNQPSPGAGGENRGGRHGGRGGGKERRGRPGWE